MRTKNAACFVIYKENKFLLQHRSDDAPSSPGKWGIFGGKIEEGESAEAACVRECKEELDYDFTNNKLLFIDEYEDEGRRYRVHVFAEKYSGQKLRLREGKDMNWFSVEELRNLNIIQGNIPILKKVNALIQ